MAHRIWQVSTRLATATVLLILTVGKTTTAATTSLGKYDPCINAGRLSRVCLPHLSPHRGVQLCLQTFDRDAYVSRSLSRAMGSMWA